MIATVNQVNESRFVVTSSAASGEADYLSIIKLPLDKN